MLVLQLTTHQHGCKAEVCFLMGITLPLIIPKRGRHLSLRNSLFQKSSGGNKEVACISILRIHFAQIKDTNMFKTTVKLL